MKHLLFICCVSFFNVITAQTRPDLIHTQELKNYPTMGCCNANPASVSAQNYSVVFREDFNGTKLNDSEWSTKFLWANDPYYNQGGAEPYYFGKEGENVFVDNGILKLKADTLIPTQTVNGKDVNYSVGQVWSKRKFRYGKVECKFKIPKGEAFWPAFWMQSNTGNSRDEIDIVEAFGNWNNGNNSYMNFSCGHLNSVTTSWESYSTNVGIKPHGEILTSGDWHVATMEWTPYFITVKIDGILTLESYRYYRICKDENEQDEYFPISCSDGFVGKCQSKYIENMAFPDDEMNVTFWLNLSPTAEWWNKKIVKTGTDFPGVAEIDYIQVEQFPQGTWGECETKMFCTFSPTDPLENASTYCFSADEVIYVPFSSGNGLIDWKSTIITHSNNITNCARAPFNSSLIGIQFPFPTDESWVQLQISEAAGINCIGQNRFVRKNLNLSYLRGSTFLDGEQLSNVVGNYYIKKGVHTIKVIPESIGIEQNSISTKILILKPNDITTLDLNETVFDFTSSVYSLITRVKSEKCEESNNYNIHPLASFPEIKLDNSIVVDDNNTIVNNEIYKELCYGNHTVSLSDLSVSNKWEINRISVNGKTTTFSSSSTFINAGTEETRYRIWFSQAEINESSNTFPQMFLDFVVKGKCCLNDGSCNSECELLASPNPASESITIKSPVDNIDAKGELYVPLINEIKIYNKYMQQLKILTGLNLTEIILDVSYLPNNEIYIVEAIDQKGSICRKKIMIVR